MKTERPKLVGVAQSSFLSLRGTDPFLNNDVTVLIRPKSQMTRSSFIIFDPLSDPIDKFISKGDEEHPRHFYGGTPSRAIVK